MTEMDVAHENLPKRIRKALEKLVQAGEVPVLVFPAVPQRYQDEKAKAFARIGAFDEAKISSWIAATEREIVFVRSGILRNRVDRFPLASVTGIEYVKEFQDNTLKIRIGGAAEDVRFYHETDGIQFYQHVKDVLDEQNAAKETGREG